eukprot:1715911-Pleurochrysis_carterae.AAC.2
MLQHGQHQPHGIHRPEVTRRREVQNASRSQTSFLKHRAAMYLAPEQPLRRMVIMMGCEGSGHHGLGHVLHQAMRAAWQHEGTVGHIIDKEPELFRALAAGQGLCPALEQAVAGKPAKTVAVLGYSFPAHDLKSERATDTHAPIYNVPLISRQAKSCNWALTLLVLRRPIASRVSSRVMIRPGVKLKRFGTTTSVTDYTREQECFDLRVSKMSKQLRHQWPLLEVHYDRFATQAGCSTQLMRMARFLARASVGAEQQAHEPIGAPDAVAMTLDEASQFCAQHFRTVADWVLLVGLPSYILPGHLREIFFSDESSPDDLAVQSRVRIHVLTRCTRTPACVSVRGRAAADRAHRAFTQARQYNHAYTRLCARVRACTRFLAPNRLHAAWAAPFRYSRKRPGDVLTPSELLAVNATAERLRNGSETCDAWRSSRFSQHARKAWPRASGAKKPS